jgi:hypothetical protein
MEKIYKVKNKRGIKAQCSEGKSKPFQNPKRLLI